MVVWVIYFALCVFVVAVVKVIDFELGAVVVARTVWWVVVVKPVVVCVTFTY